MRLRTTSLELGDILVLFFNLHSSRMEKKAGRSAEAGMEAILQRKGPTAKSDLGNS